MGVLLLSAERRRERGGGGGGDASGITLSKVGEDGEGVVALDGEGVRRVVAKDWEHSDSVCLMSKWKYG